MSFDSLPIIVVSAYTQTAADEFIREIIDEDVTVELRPPEQASADRVWRLRNKYYSAEVRVRARAAGDEAAGGEVGAHVVLLEEAEAGDEAAARARLDERVGLPARPPDVCVVACRARALPPHLQAECARRMLEPVALLDAQEGVPAVRAALHAHPWPGMRRAPRRSSLEDGAESVEAMERFAAALGALGGGAQAVRGLQGAARREAAEQLVAAFAAALGHDLDL